MPCFTKFTINFSISCYYQSMIWIPQKPSFPSTYQTYFIYHLTSFFQYTLIIPLSVQNQNKTPLKSPLKHNHLWNGKIKIPLRSLSIQSWFDRQSRTMSPPSAEGCILAVLFACTFTACISVTSAQFQCPHTDCVVDCVSQTETDCDSDQILVADTSVCGCCAKCVGGAGNAGDRQRAQWR